MASRSPSGSFSISLTLALIIANRSIIHYLSKLVYRFVQTIVMFIRIEAFDVKIYFRIKYLFISFFDKTITLVTSYLTTVSWISYIRFVHDGLSPEHQV